MYSGHGHLCVCLSLAAFPHYCMDPDVTWVGGALWPCTIGWICNRCTGFVAMTTYTHKLIALYTANAKCQRVLVLALCLVLKLIVRTYTHTGPSAFPGPLVVGKRCEKAKIKDCQMAKSVMIY